MPRHRRIAVYPGSFDPITWGHMDIITRATRLFDRIVVAVTENPLKTPVFSLTQRTQMIEETLKKGGVKGSVRVDHFDGLLVSYCRRIGACAVVRGLRAVSDFEFEFQMALMNRRLAKDIETVFLMPDERYVYLSSSLVKEVARLGGNLGAFVPPGVRSSLKTLSR